MRITVGDSSFCCRVHVMFMFEPQLTPFVCCVGIITYLLRLYLLASTAAVDVFTPGHVDPLVLLVESIATALLPVA